MSTEKLAAANEIIPLRDVIKLKNAYIEPFIKNALVLAISDKGQAPPVVFKQAEDKVFYALSSQNRYND